MAGLLPAGLTPINTPSPGASTGGGVLDYDSLKAIAAQAGAGDDAGIMARIALAESSGNPRSNANHKTSYVEKGKTYYPEGLWQISTVHGYKDDMFSVLNNARRAVELFKAQGFGPWEASRHGGAGGGWGQYLHSELGPNAQGFDTGGGSGGGANEQLYAGMAGGLPPGLTPIGQSTLPPGLTPIASPSPDSTLPPGLTPTQHYQTAGVGEIPQRLASDAVKFATNKPLEHSSPLAKAETAAREAFYLATIKPMNAMFNVLGTPNRVVMEGLSGEVGHEFGAAGQDLQHGDIAGAAKHLWGLVGNVNDTHMAKLTSDTEHMLHMPEHAIVDNWVKNNVPKDAQGAVSAILKGGEDFAAQAATDPLTYSGFGDVVKGAEFLKLLNPLFSGGRIATLTYKAADALGMGAAFSHMKVLSKLYDNTIGEFTGQFKNLFAIRPDLQNLSPAMRQVRMAQENGIAARSVAAREAEAKSLRGASDEQAAAVYRRYFSEHGSAKNAAEANKGLTKDVQFAGKASGVLKDPHFKSSLAEFVNREHPGETDGELFRRRMGILDDFRDKINRGEANAQTIAAVQKYGTEADKKYVDQFGGKMKTSRDWAERAAKTLDSSPFTSQLRNWSRKAIMWNPLPHAMKNVGTLAFLAGGPEALVKGLWYMAKGGISEEQRARQLANGAAAYYQRLERAAPSSGLGHISDEIYEKSANTMQYMEESWRQALLDQFDRAAPTRTGTEFEHLDEWKKGFLVADRVGDYHNQAAFVHLMESIGGPFIAFRLGIVPRKVMQAIRHNPERPLSIVRAQYDINQNRQGKDRNEARIGGPMGDFSEMTMGPPIGTQLMFGLRSVLPLGGQAGDDWFWQNKTWGQMASTAAETYVPYYSAVMDSIRIAGGQAMPGPGVHDQPMGLTDKLVASFLTAFGMYYHKLPTKKWIESQLKQMGKKGGI